MYVFFQADCFYLEIHGQLSSVLASVATLYQRKSTRYHDKKRLVDLLRYIITNT